MVEAQTKRVLQIDVSKYPVLARFSHEMGLDASPVEGREVEMGQLRADLSRPVISNAMLLAGAGTGKTALVESYAANYTSSNEHVLELDVVAMAENGRDQFNASLKRAMDEVQKLQHMDQVQLDIFVDEFHVVPMNGGTDAIKPILARSGRLGIRFIAATTNEEYFDYIKPNQALDQRMQPIKLSEPSDQLMLKILRSTINYYAPDMNGLFTDHLLKKVIEYGKYQPAMFQPRKSILYIDAMIGNYRTFGTKPSVPHLNAVLAEMTGIQADWKADIDRTVEILKSRVKGQDTAINIMRDSLNVSVAGLNDPSKPMGSYLFAGTTGTGKTELSRTLAKALFGTERAMQRYDMSEYQTQDSVQVFQDRITTGLTSQPYTILLFDELEKAHPGVRNLLLQLLDDGRMTDKYGRQISGLNAYIIMTTNLGASTLADVANKDADAREYEELLFSELSITLKPEFLGRLSAIVPFQPLSNKTLVEIAELRFKELNRRIYQKYGIQLRLSPKKQELGDGYRQEIFEANRVLAYIVTDKVVRNANNGGGRAVSRRIEQEVASAVSDFVNKHPRPHLKYDYLVLEVSGKMVLDDMYDSEGSAHLVVRPHKKSLAK